MFRAVFFPRRDAVVTYKTQDLIHDAVISAVLSQGISSDRLLGENAVPWTFAATHTRGEREANGLRTYTLKALEVSTADEKLASSFRKIQPEDLSYARASTGEMLSLAGGSKREKSLILPTTGHQTVGITWASPLVMSEDRSGKVWFLTNALDIEKQSERLNKALSHRAGRPVQLKWSADRLEARIHPKGVHTTVKVFKGKACEVIGTRVPFVLQGSEDDLRFAWYAGVGQKTRMGFGCWNLYQGDHE